MRNEKRGLGWWMSKDVIMNLCVYMWRRVRGRYVDGYWMWRDGCYMCGGYGGCNCWDNDKEFMEEWMRERIVYRSVYDREGEYVDMRNEVSMRDGKCVEVWLSRELVVNMDMMRSEWGGWFDENEWCWYDDVLKCWL